MIYIQILRSSWISLDHFLSYFWANNILLQETIIGFERKMKIVSKKTRRFEIQYKFIFFS